MSKVLVDRELLERACMRPGRESLAVNDRDIIERGRAQAEIRELLAQPAEAEGADRQRMIESMCLTWRHDFGLDKPDDCQLSSGMTDKEREHLRGQMGKLFDHHFAPALSAVTAERDTNSMLTNALETAERERDRLRAEVEALREDAERYRWLRGRLPGSAYRIAGVIYSEGGDGVDAAVDAAMAAKEA